MPNLGIWEWIVILILIWVPLGWYLILASKALPTVIREIRLMWHNADPNDNGHH